MRLRRRHDDSQLESLLAELAARTSAPPEDELRELARRIASEPRVAPPRARTHGYSRWVVVAAAAAVAAGALGFGLGAWTTEDSVAGTSLTGVGFLPAKGWTVVQDGRLGSGPAQTAIAANVPLDPDDDLRDAPVATLESMPARGVLIAASFTARGVASADAGFPNRTLPLRLEAAEPVPAGLDPIPVRRALARYRLVAAVGLYNVDARIYFGTSTPSRAQRAVAQSQLDRLFVGTERITLLARPAIRGRNMMVTLYGSVDSRKADEEITIEGRECGQTEWRVVTGAHSAQGGSWTTQYAPTITTTVRAVWDGARSAPLTIQNRVWVQLSTRARSAKGFGFRVAVTAELQMWKRHVIVQRYERRLGRWRDVKKVVLTETGAAPGSSYIWTSANFHVNVPAGTRIRATFPLSQARPCYLAGYSNQLET
jgi:hypothetical protein